MKGFPIALLLTLALSGCSSAPAVPAPESRPPRQYTQEELELLKKNQELYEAMRKRGDTFSH